MFSRFAKSKSLRIVNLLGLAIVFACILLACGYLKKELSYDRHYSHADRIVRLSVQFDADPVDGRVYKNIGNSLAHIPEIERIVKLVRVNTAVLDFDGNSQIVNDIYFASSGFFEVFDLPLLTGEKEHILQSPGTFAVSESFALRLFGSVDAVGKEIQIDGRQSGKMTGFISGVYKDFPETSHLHTDMLIHRPDDQTGHWTYYYLLVNHPSSIPALAGKITASVAEYDPDPEGRVIKALVTPLVDIHLHSKMLREMEPNGNIYYIYLVIGANILLLSIVLFNLWLNVSLIFSFNRRYYQLLRLNGASSFTVLKDETLLALTLGICAVCVGFPVAHLVPGNFDINLTVGENIVLALLFLLLVLSVSLIPVFAGLSSTLFSNTGDDLQISRFSYAGVKYMLTAQYVIVMLAAILGFGINRQMSTVRNEQAGGDTGNILVMAEQPDQVQQRYSLLKTKLLEHSEIEDVTACFQLPGDAIRDAIQLRCEDDDELKQLAILVAGESFIPFFNIKLAAGNNFMPLKMTRREEEQLMWDKFEGNPLPDGTEEYIINRKALKILGIQSPEEATGKMLYLHGFLDYIPKGRICGVVDDFYYNSLHEESIPLLIMQRNLFMHCIMVRFDPRQYDKALESFNAVWNEVNPDFPANYTFMKDVFGKIYRNELNAEKLTLAFSALCLAIASMGLIIFMAFMIKRRTREIGIRKINGASTVEIIRMLNMNFIRWILLAFIIAIPAAFFIMRRWMENFAAKTETSWQVFALAGLSVLLLSLVAVSVQTLRAATANPAEALKSE